MTLEVLAQYAKAVGGHLEVTVVKVKDKVCLLPAAKTAKATKPPAARAKVATRPTAEAVPTGRRRPTSPEPGAPTPTPVGPLRQPTGQHRWVGRTGRGG